jgi:hypothetical protein
MMCRAWLVRVATSGSGHADSSACTSSIAVRSLYLTHQDTITGLLVASCLETRGLQGGAKMRCAARRVSRPICRAAAANTPPWPP